MFAVIQVGSSQHKVSPGQEILIDHQHQNEGLIKFNRVLLISDDKQITIGKPTISAAVVTAEIIGQVKGEKVRIGKYKAKSRYRKVRGFRAQLTKVSIREISLTGKIENTTVASTEKPKIVRSTRTKKVS